MVKQVPKFSLNVVSPEKLLFSQEVEMAVIPGEVGDFAVLPKHEAFISTLRPGMVEIFEKEKPKEYIFVDGGFAEVSDDVCTVLSEEVVFAEHIDIDELEQFIQDTHENIQMARTEEERKSLETNLNLADAKLEIIKRIGKS